MEKWQEEVIAHVLEDNSATRVPSNGRHIRFYTENLADSQWDSRHHLIDLENNGTMYSELTISEMSSAGNSSQVRLSHNEVDGLLKSLLEWYFEQHQPKPDPLDETVNEHPF